MFRIAACGNDAPIPERYEQATIDAHCDRMRGIYDSYRKAWVDEAQAVHREAAPEATSDDRRVSVRRRRSVVRADRVSRRDRASRRSRSKPPATFARSTRSTRSGSSYDLKTIAENIRRLYHAAHSTTKSLQQSSHSELPGTIMFALAGLAVHGIEPVQMRYFDIETDGSLPY